MSRKEEVNILEHCHESSRKLLPSVCVEDVTSCLGGERVSFSRFSRNFGVDLCEFCSRDGFGVDGISLASCGGRTFLDDS